MFEEQTLRDSHDVKCDVMNKRVKNKDFLFHLSLELAIRKGGKLGCIEIKGPLRWFGGLSNGIFQLILPTPLTYSFYIRRFFTRKKVSLGPIAL